MDGDSEDAAPLSKRPSSCAHCIRLLVQTIKTSCLHQLLDWNLGSGGREERENGRWWDRWAKRSQALVREGTARQRCGNKLILMINGKLALLVAMSYLKSPHSLTGSSTNAPSTPLRLSVFVRLHIQVKMSSHSSKMSSHIVIMWGYFMQCSPSRNGSKQNSNSAMQSPITHSPLYSLHTGGNVPYACMVTLWPQLHS